MKRKTKKASKGKRAQRHEPAPEDSEPPPVLHRFDAKANNAEDESLDTDAKSNLAVEDENVETEDQENRGNGSDADEDRNGIKTFPQAHFVIPFKSTILQSLNGILYNWNREPRPFQEALVRKMAVNGTLERYRQCTQTSQRFGRRITEISWHQKEPYFLGAACKHGDILLFKGSCDQDGDFKMQQRLAIKGSGPDGGIFSIRYDENRRNQFYTAGLDGMVNSFDIVREGERIHEFYNTGDYNHWFTSMDVSQPTRTLLAGCTKGFIYLSTLDGDNIAKTRIHKGKVLHVEFNQVVPHLIVTSSIDKTVKLWDLRKLSENEPLHVLPHDKPVNVARFNPLNSSRLLTSDQGHDLRIYQGPNWTETTRIKQPHRQFQHITAIVASWHPLSDIIGIGKYPVVPKGTRNPPPRPIQFFDADTGDMIHQLYPTFNEIVSLNMFSPMGDILAAGQGRNLIFFNQQEHSQILDKQAKMLKRKNANDSYQGLRFDRRRRDSDSDSEGEEDANEKKRKRKGSSSTPSGKKKPGKTTQNAPKKRKRE